jgi:hypothetical protein
MIILPCGYFNNISNPMTPIPLTKDNDDIMFFSNYVLPAPKDNDDIMFLSHKHYPSVNDNDNIMFLSGKVTVPPPIIIKVNNNIEME